MKKTIILSILTIVFTHNLYAQEMAGIAIFSKIGYTSLPGSSSTLTNIAPHGSTVNNNSTAFGAEGYFRINKVILVLDGNMAIQNAESADANKARIFQCVAYTKVGRIILDKTHYWIYPSLGLGVASIDINTYNNENDEVTNLKNKVLSSPSFDFGFNADFIANKIMNREGYGAWLLGLRTGYRVSIKNCGWRDNDGNKLSNMPSYTYKGFYVMVTIGGGVFVRK
jgi:hypothetical protein